MAVVLPAGTVLVAVASAATGEGAEVPATVEPAPIAANGLRGRPVVEGHSFGFSVNVSPCLGPGLTLDHVTVVERPENAHHLKAAIVTSYLLHPAHREREKCAKVRRVRFARVKTKRPAAELVFFDGSSSPPRRIWPPIKSTPLRQRPSHSCGPARGTTLLAGRRGRIYTLPGSEPPRTERLYACLVATQRTWTLVSYADIEPVALNAPWVAYPESIRGRDTSRLKVAVKNLRTGATLYCQAGFRIAPASRPHLTGIGLKRDASLAWIGESRPPPSSGRGPLVPVVGVCDSTGSRVLDSGEGIDLHSLKLHGSTLTWTDEGETRSATLN
jgi:hypothetical protein